MEHKKKFAVLGPSVSPSMEKELAARDIAIIPASIGLFDSGEPFVELFKGDKANYLSNKEKLRGAQVTIVQSTGDLVSQNIQQLIQMIHTLKHYGAAEVNVAMPFAAFARQDREFPERFVSLAAELLPQQLKAAGADKVITVTPHSQAAMGFYRQTFGDANFTPLTTTKLFADDIRARFEGNLANVIIGAPDGANKPEDEGQIRAHELARDALGNDDDARMFRISKMHTGVSDTKITHFDGDVAGKHCVVVDDMIDGGSTVINASTLLKARGAASVTVYATQAILSKNALENVLSAKHDGMNHAIDRLVLTETLPSVTKKLEQLQAEKPKLAERLSIVSVAPMLAEEIQRQHEMHTGFAKAFAR